MPDTREQLEQTWREAFTKRDRSRNPTVALMQAEDQAWDALSEYCDEHNECKAPNCRAITPEHAYCKDHRDA